MPERLNADCYATQGNPLYIIHQHPEEHAVHFAATESASSEFATPDYASTESATPNSVPPDFVVCESVASG